MRNLIRYRIVGSILLLIIFIQAGFIWRFFFKKRLIGRFPVIKGEIVIVLDDWGYNLDNLEILKEIPQPLVLAILPHLEYSREISDFAKSIGKEVILHLPLEPKKSSDYLGWEKFTITVNMGEEEIKRIVSKAIINLGEVKGVSNHMGSRATEHEKTMNVIFKEIKKRGFYFLDNRVSGGSICRYLSKKLSLKFISRDIFLDNEKRIDYIKTQLNKLKIIALNKGHAVGVGHNRPLTLKILKEELPKIEKEGFKFVFLSELIK
ncbi:MAG: divergent polysaccharide deacetylase family protein [Candidatus Omnitrophica bacterium]|nr:divergent polysaccharide deacetylase family protein [Candidatus Omnitrophota bacterium]